MFGLRLTIRRRKSIALRGTMVDSFDAHATSPKHFAAVDAAARAAGGFVSLSAHIPQRSDSRPAECGWPQHTLDDPCMIADVNNLWQELAAAQAGLIARRQLRALGIDRNTIQRHLRAGRWVVLSSNVVGTFTGRLDWEQRAWLGVLHAGGNALVGGLTGARLLGLRRWERPDITVLVGAKAAIAPVEGIQFVRTRRPLASMKSNRLAIPTARIEPATLLHAAYHEKLRTATGLLAAVVQQRLSTVDSLSAWLDRMVPIRGLRQFHAALAEIGDGAQSAAELDISAMCRNFGLRPPVRQRKRYDSRGKARFTDAEWDLPNGHVLVLEVDGSFHMNVEHWQEDIARQRGLAAPHRHVIRCTSYELQHTAGLVAADLRRFLSSPGS